MITFLLSRIRVFLLTLAMSLLFSSSAFGAVTIVIQNNDQPNVGFNDPTPVAPVGGNNGTTLGQQRLNAFQFAATNIWGATLTSGTTITVRASWSNTMACAVDSAVLGSAGATSLQRNFANAPFANTWYGGALANKLAGSDVTIGAEISAQFNLRIGTTGCLPNSPWYLGLDNNHGNRVDLVSVLIHELGHGLGFQTFTNPSNGVQPSGFPSVFDKFLRDNTTGKLWGDMTNAERVASAINTGNLAWVGNEVTQNVPNVLGPAPRLRINSPAAIAGNYKVGTADFGAPLSTFGVTGNVVQATPANGCTAIGGSVSGKIAFIDRGDCNFTVKVKNAQNAGATGVIISNVASSVDPNIAPGMGGSDLSIFIPSVGISFPDGNTIRAQLGSTPNATMLLDPLSRAGADSSNHALLYAPNPFDAGSSVSHFDTGALPNQLMEPNISDDLTRSVTPPQVLTFSLLADLGWAASSGNVWMPTTLNSSEVELKSWTIEGRTFDLREADVPGCWFSSGRLGNAAPGGNDFSADATVERFNGVSAQAITSTAQI